jgi:hypothetical protein
LGGATVLHQREPGASAERCRSQGDPAIGDQILGADNMRPVSKFIFLRSTMRPAERL